MDVEELKKRTLAFSIRIIKMVDALPDTQAGRVVGNQVLKSGTSIGSNYREAQHASSPRHFVTVMEIAQREASETSYWLEVIMEADMLTTPKVKPLYEESRALYAILTSTILTRKKALRRKPPGQHQ